MNLPEKHRPRQWSEVIGQDKVVKALQQLRDGPGLGGNAFWLSGKSGTGKTTIARLIAAEVAEYALCITEIDADDLDVDLIKEIKGNMKIRLGRAWIINEAHGLTKQRARKLLTVLEPPEGLPAHVVFIFTTTIEGQKTLFEGVDDAGPLLSRCQEYPLAQTGLGQTFAEHARKIAIDEGLDGRPISFYLERVKQNRNNLRAVLQEVQQGRMRS